MTPIETQHTIRIKIEEPPIAGVFYIRDKWLDKAKRFNKKIVLEYEGQIYITSYKEWMKGAKKMEKVFLIPDRPMLLWGQYIEKFKKKPEPEIIGNVMGSAIGGMKEEQIAFIKAKLGLI